MTLLRFKKKKVVVEPVKPSLGSMIRTQAECTIGGTIGSIAANVVMSMFRK